MKKRNNLPLVCSCIIMGTGQLLYKQWIKGLLYLAVFGWFIYFLVSSAVAKNWEMIESSLSTGFISAGTGDALITAKTLWANLMSVSDGRSIWDKIKVFYLSLFGEQAYGVGVAAGNVKNIGISWFGKVQEAFGNVFTKGWSGFVGAGASSHAIVWSILAVVLALLLWIAYKIIKKIRSRKRAATTESYVSLLSDQSFLEAKQVAYYLKENTAMSKKDCNKIANFVYKKSLDRKLNNLI